MSGYYRLYRNGVLLPEQYREERKATQDATNILLDDPTAKVECKPEFVINYTASKVT